MMSENVAVLPSGVPKEVVPFVHAMTCCQQDKIDDDQQVRQDVLRFLQPTDREFRATPMPWEAEGPLFARYLATLTGVEDGIRLRSHKSATALLTLVGMVSR